jgi:gliding motility-associated-like protein
MQGANIGLQGAGQAGNLGVAGANVGLQGANTQLQAAVTGVINPIYLWSPNTNITSTTIYNPIVSPSITTTYTVTVTNPATGCKQSESVIINLNIKNLWGIPTAFSPNNDGLNDQFQILLAPGVKILTNQVYNRWGEKMWDNTQQWWNGQFNGKPMPIGTYVYYFVFQLPDATTQKVKGDILLVR